MCETNTCYVTYVKELARNALVRCNPPGIISFTILTEALLVFLHLHQGKK